MSQHNQQPCVDGARHVDVVVVGAGVGGLCSAALLAHQGRRVLVVERDDRVGGRATTREIDGFLVGAGAVAIERHGPMEQVFDTVGAPFDVRLPERGVVLRLVGRDIDTTSRFARIVVDGVIRRAFALATRRAVTRPATGEETTFKEWLTRFTSNRRVHRVCRNISAGFYSLNSDEVPAHVLLHYLLNKSAFRTIGFNPQGTIGPLRELARTIERDGGEVWCSAQVTRILVQDGRATGVVVRQDDGEIEVTCDEVICNAGPDTAIALCGEDAFPHAYVQLVRERSIRAPMYAINFASRRPLTGDAGILFFADTERVCAVSHLTSVCPEMAPPGWLLYVASGVPVPALGPFDEEAERQAMLRELAEQLDGFEEARLISAPLEWPVLVLPGQELDSATPVANLWNVGDGTRAFADIGMQGCAANGIEVADRVLAARTPRSAARATA